MRLSNNFKRTLTVVAVIASLWLALCAILSLWGKHQWRETKAALLAQGESLSLNDLAPPEIPATENFFAAPLWDDLQAFSKNAPNFTSQLSLALGGPKSAAVPKVSSLVAPYSQPLDLDRAAETLGRINKTNPQGEATVAFLLRQLQPAEPALAALTEAVQRPGARSFPNYASFGVQPQAQSTLNWTYWGQLAKAIGLRAVVECAAGDGASALRDTLTQVQLIHHLDREPLFELELVRLELISNINRIIWHGLYYRCWNIEQLEELSVAVASISVWPTLLQVYRGERARLVQWAEPIIEKEGIIGLNRSYHSESFEPQSYWFLSLLPSGIVYGDMAAFSRQLQETIQRLQDPVFPKAKLVDGSPQPELRTWEWFYPQKISILTTRSWLNKFTRNTLEADVRLQQAAIALKLEIYRLKHEHYPASLTEIPHLPRNPMSGGPFDYRLVGEGGYTLGSPALAKEGNSTPSDQVAEWTWRMPVDRPSAH